MCWTWFQKFGPLRKLFDPPGVPSWLRAWCKSGSLLPLRASGSVAPLRRSSAGWLPARRGSLSAGAGRGNLITVRKASLMIGSMRRVWALRGQAGAHSGVEWTRVKMTVRYVVARASKPPQESDAWCQLLVSWHVSDLSNVAPSS